MVIDNITDQLAENKKDQQLNIKVEKEENYTLITLKGRVSSIDFPKEIMGSLVDELSEKRTNLIIDMADVSYIDSSGLNLLLILLTKSRNIGGETVLINLSTLVQNLLIVTKLNSIFPIFDSLDMALESLSPEKLNEKLVEQVDTAAEETDDIE